MLEAKLAVSSSVEYRLIMEVIACIPLATQIYSTTFEGYSEKTF
jgi:hypothetical protein